MNRLKLIQLSFFIIFLSACLSSCEVIGGIFKAGVWVGVLVVVGIIALILFFIGRSKK
jgi:hypothetical protein